MEHSTAALNASEEITPYRVHVSSKYLELTKKKLELTRLPHELLLPKAREWEFGTPKGVVEPLIDFWLEEYHWREREEHLNTTLPQFRTAISLPPALSTSIPPPPLEQAPTPPLRIHFIHLRSPHPSAIPLLLLPPFPLTNLSLSSSPLFTSLSKPESPTSMQAFHVVCPSIPGLGFSDAFTSSSSVLEQTADLFNTLMLRLGYVEYLCSSTASGRESPAGIDYRLPRMMGERFAENCVGVHVLEPVVEAPRVGRQTVAWMKFNVAKFFQANVWGYENEDWIALRASAAAARNPSTGESGKRRALLRGGRGSGGYGATAHLGLREPNTLSYALTDSPVGILSMILSSLHKTSPEHKLSETQIIDITQLAWLPGPEAGLRFLSSASKDLENNEARETTRKSRIAVTVFTEESGYTPPAWLSTTHSIIFTQRVPGKAGLTIWERSDVLLSGIRGLARSLDTLGRLPSPLERVVVTVAEVDEEEDDDEGHEFQLDVESPDTDHTIVAAS
ncbi:related to epoxide hydrolase [Phialocephala subalpina]|uniref:Related to epoxide hydrolase n=1 Tax=Phialocephala subalpina TaxID=576137 RepID=A0A1L7WUA2_9HELO|nr:related to epoxide hydrolase [Phialocephala subalpina]